MKYYSEGTTRGMLYVKYRGVELTVGGNCLLKHITERYKEG
jgi:hypothetical protein